MDTFSLLTPIIFLGIFVSFWGGLEPKKKIQPKPADPKSQEPSHPLNPKNHQTCPPGGPTGDCRKEWQIMNQQKLKSGDQQKHSGAGWKMEAPGWSISMYFPINNGEVSPASYLEAVAVLEWIP